MHLKPYAFKTISLWGQFIKKKNPWGQFVTSLPNLFIYLRKLDIICAQRHRLILEFCGIQMDDKLFPKILTPLHTYSLYLVYNQKSIPIQWFTISCIGSAKELEFVWFKFYLK
jgi:hypothetical protein